MSAQEKLDSLNLEKYFWLITENKYHNLRVINGCENLTDIQAAEKDLNFVM